MDAKLADKLVRDNLKEYVANLWPECNPDQECDRLLRAFGSDEYVEKFLNYNGQMSAVLGLSPAEIVERALAIARTFDILDTRYDSAFSAINRSVNALLHAKLSTTPMGER